jgi:hypothetical protein
MAHSVLRASLRLPSLEQGESIENRLSRPLILTAPYTVVPVADEAKSASWLFNSSRVEKSESIETRDDDIRSSTSQSLRIERTCNPATETPGGLRGCTPFTASSTTRQSSQKGRATAPQMVDIGNGFFLFTWLPESTISTNR